MRKLEKKWGFRSNTTWKKILASLYYLFCILNIIQLLNDVPVIKTNIYDMVIHKISTVLMWLSYLEPIIFVSNFKLKNKIPILKKKKWWSDVFGFIIVFLFMIFCSNTVTLFHSKDYLQRYEEYNATEIIYQNQDSDEIPEEQKSTLTKNELEEELKDLTSDNKTNIVNDTTNIENKNDEITNNNHTIKNNKMKIHFIDVGQGDSIFIELPNNTTMLIDAGEASKGKTVANYIKVLGYSKINYLIGTHPHTDHIGGLAYIINNFDIESIYMPKAISTSKTYENLLNTISEKKLKIKNAKAGVNIFNNNNLKIDIIAPNKDSYSDLNNFSAVIKLTYGNNKFLFMGDAETKSESEIVANVTADVIKIGHHGSDTSSSKDFVNRVNPKYVIVMVGAGNKYDHPYINILDRWTDKGATIYRTDLNGNIVVTSDGNSIDISSSK